MIQGFIVGSISGICRFYEAGMLFSYKVILFFILFNILFLNVSKSLSPGSELSLDAEIHIGGRRRSNSNMITGIQVLPQCLLLSNFIS